MSVIIHTIYQVHTNDDKSKLRLFFLESSQFPKSPISSPARDGLWGRKSEIDTFVKRVTVLNKDNGRQE